MKKNLIVSLFIFFAFQNFLKAQDRKVLWGIGIRVGTASLSAKPDATKSLGNDSITTAYSVGVRAEISFNRFFSIKPELNYSFKGGSYQTGLNGIRTSRIADNINVSYIEAPLSLKFKPLNGLFISAGPQIGYLILAQSDGGTNGLDAGYTDNYKRLDYGFMFGLGFSRKRFGMEGNYYLGLQNIVKNGPSIHGSPSSFKNQVATIGLFYNFGE